MIFERPFQEKVEPRSGLQSLLEPPAEVLSSTAGASAILSIFFRGFVLGWHHTTGTFSPRHQPRLCLPKQSSPGPGRVEAVTLAQLAASELPVGSGSRRLQCGSGAGARRPSATRLGTPSPRRKRRAGWTPPPSRHVSSSTSDNDSGEGLKTVFRTPVPGRSRDAPVAAGSTFRSSAARAGTPGLLGRSGFGRLHSGAGGVTPLVSVPTTRFRLPDQVVRRPTNNVLKPLALRLSCSAEIFLSRYWDDEIFKKRHKISQSCYNLKVVVTEGCSRCGPPQKMCVALGVERSCFSRTSHGMGQTEAR